MSKPIVIYLPFPGYWDHKVTVNESYSEGYPTGEISIEHLTWEQLQAITDFLIGLPPELYEHVKVPHQLLEGLLARRREKRS